MRRFLTLILTVGMMMALPCLGNTQPGPCWDSAQFISSSAGPGTHCNPACVSPDTCYDFSYDVIMFCDTPKTVPCSYSISVVVFFNNGGLEYDRHFCTDGTIDCGKYKVEAKLLSACAPPGGGFVKFIVYDDICGHLASSIVSETVDF